MALIKIGQLAPTFMATNLTGSDVALENYMGKSIVLVFVDRISSAEIKPLMSLYKNRGTRVEMLTVARRIPSISMAKAFLKQVGVSYPVIYDQNGEISKRYGVENLVAIFIIDAAGYIASSEQVDSKSNYVLRVQNAMAIAPESRGQSEEHTADNTISGLKRESLPQYIDNMHLEHTGKTKPGGWLESTKKGFRLTFYLYDYQATPTTSDGIVRLNMTSDLQRGGSFKTSFSVTKTNFKRDKNGDPYFEYFEIEPILAESGLVWVEIWFKCPDGREVYGRNKA